MVRMNTLKLTMGKVEGIKNTNTVFYINIRIKCNFCSALAHDINIVITYVKISYVIIYISNIIIYIFDASTSQNRCYANSTFCLDQRYLFYFFHKAPLYMFNQKGCTPQQCLHHWMVFCEVPISVQL